MISYSCGDGVRHPSAPAVEMLTGLMTPTKQSGRSFPFLKEGLDGNHYWSGDSVKIRVGGSEAGSEKHLPYFEVLDSFRTSRGCPLCALEGKGLHGYFEGLLYERVLDGRVRESLVRSRGYCDSHASYLARYPDHLGVAMIYRDQVALMDAFLESCISPRRHLARWRRHEPCPACDFVLKRRQRHASILASWFREEDMARALEKSSPLCAVHSMVVLDRITDAGLAARFREVQRRKLAVLIGEVDEFISKHCVERTGEPYGPELDSWRRAVEVMTTPQWLSLAEERMP